jgi:hypothetical protein
LGAGYLQWALDIYNGIVSVLNGCPVPHVHKQHCGLFVMHYVHWEDIRLDVLGYGRL